jgi:hypothetical protein
MVWKGIQVQDGMQQAGFCAVGRGKFSWHHLTFGPLSMQPTITTDMTIASKLLQFI